MTDTNVHATCTVGEIFRMAIARHPDREALVCRGRRYSYRAMGEEISKFTQALAARGVGRGDAVAMLTANRAEAVFVQAALAHLGARLSWLHPLGSVADHQFIIEDAEITTLIVDADGYAEKGIAVAQAAPDMRCLSFGPAGGADTEGAEDLSALAAGFAPAPLTDLGDPDDIAYILYTGGTTGRPKGWCIGIQALFLPTLSPCMAGTGRQRRGRLQQRRYPMLPVHSFRRHSCSVVRCICLPGLIRKNISPPLRVRRLRWAFWCRP